MCVCVNICIYIYVCVVVYDAADPLWNESIQMVCICMCVYIYMYVYVYVYVYICIVVDDAADPRRNDIYRWYVYVRTHTCMYIYIYIYMNIHIYIYIHTYIYIYYNVNVHNISAQYIRVHIFILTRDMYAFRRFHPKDITHTYNTTHIYVYIQTH
jgi:hypothetical protein